MQRWPRIAAIWLLASILLGACTSTQAQPAFTQNPAAQATPLPSPTITPTPPPTPEPTFAAGARIAGVDVSGLTSAAAAERLRTALAGVNRPLELRAGAASLTVRPADIDLELPITDLLTEAEQMRDQGEQVRVPLRLSFDRQALRDQLETLAAEAAVPAAITVISATATISRSFAYTPGQMLDVATALRQVEQRLQTPQESRRLTLRLRDDPTVPQVGFDQVEEQLTAMAGGWKGVVGFYLHDLDTGETATLNANTVFAGASTIKAAIMLNAYINLPTFNERQITALRRMIIDSDNLAANDLMAAAAGGRSTEYAFTGAEQMSAMLADLGLKNTYLYVPFESVDYIRQNNVKYKCGPRDPVGEPPYTETGCALRTTPSEMGRLYVWLDQCAQGDGPLIDTFDLLSAKRCQEMLDLLEENADDSRMLSGLPDDVRVEHKSGWIGDMQADAGIVRSPNGDFVLSIYVFRALPKGVALWGDELMAPVIGAFARLAYTAYNPIKLDR